VVPLQPVGGDRNGKRGKAGRPGHSGRPGHFGKGGKEGAVLGDYLADPR
jgi:hypothetical protein